MIFINFTSTFFSFWEDFAEDLRPGELDKTAAAGSFSETSQDNISDF